MKREFLKEQGLSDEQIKAVMTEPRNSKAVSALLDLDKVSLSDNGNGLESLNDQLTALKESDSYLFNVKNELQPTKSSVNVVSGQPKGEGTPTINLATASYQEIKQFKDNHPDEYQALTKD